MNLPDEFWDEVRVVLGDERHNEMRQQYNAGLLRRNNIVDEVDMARPVNAAEQERRNNAEERQRIAGEEFARWRVEDQVEHLNIANAPHIGDLELNLSNDTNSLSLDKFVNGEELVRLKHSNLPTNIYKIDDLQGWFNRGNNTNPQTREIITQADIERFRYVEKLTMGGRRKGKKSRKSRKGKKASRKYRKTNRRNGK